MTEHTPGPWKLIWHGNETYPFPFSLYSDDNKNWIARDGKVSSEANARLIAAAPDLLNAATAAEGVIDNLIGMYGDGGAGLVLRELQMAIRRAKGEE